MISDDDHPGAAYRTRWTTPTFPSSASKYEGKVRDCYTKDGRRTIIVTDRMSAFDVVLGTIPFKGQVLNQIAALLVRGDQAIWPRTTSSTCPTRR